MEIIKESCEDANAFEQVTNKIYYSKLGFQCCVKYNEDIDVQF